MVLQDESARGYAEQYSYSSVRVSEDVNIDVYNRLLMIIAENKISSGHDENSEAAHERRYGKFSRTL